MEPQGFAVASKVVADTLNIRLGRGVAEHLGLDVEYRVKELCQDALKFRHHSKRTKVTTGDINSALRVRGLEPVFGYMHKDPIAYVRLNPSKRPGVYTENDPEVDLVDVLAEKLPKAPLDMSLTSHWLSVKGEQPDIPQNPPMAEIRAHDVQRHKLRIEVDNTPEMTAEIVHSVPKEMQEYYQTLTQRLETMTDTNVFEQLKEETGLQPLVPFFCKYVQEQVVEQLEDAERLLRLMKAMEAMILNEHMDWSDYLQDILPSVLTCLVGKRLGIQGQDHWSTRAKAADVVEMILELYDEVVPSLRSRIQQTLGSAVRTPARGLTSCYGSLLGLYTMSWAAIEKEVFPFIKQIGGKEWKGSIKATREDEAQRVHALLKDMVQTYLQNIPIEEWGSVGTPISGRRKGRKKVLKAVFPDIVDVLGVNIV